MSRRLLYSFFSRFEHRVVLAAYLLAALAMSYPLVTQFGDHIPGIDGDVWSYLWAMGWAREALLNDATTGLVATNPFHSDLVLYPLGGATQLLWGTALPSFASIPLQLAFGLVPAFNVGYLAASVLTGYGMYLVAKEVLLRAKELHLRAKRVSGGGREQLVHSTQEPGIQGASFVAGLVFAFGALRLGYGIAFTNLFHTEFMPFFVLFLWRATRRRGWKDAVLAGLFFALNVYVDFQIAAFLGLLAVLWFVYGAATAAWNALKANKGIDLPAIHLRQWGVMSVVAGLASLPMLLFLFQDLSLEGGDYIRVYPLKYSAERSYDLLSFVLPNARSSLYASLPAPRIDGVNASVNTEGESEFSPDRQAFLGVTALVLALVGAVRFRRVLLFWILVVLVFGVLALGPVLHIAGNNSGIPLPFMLLNGVPILNHIRIPMRYGLMVFFGASLLAGAGASVFIGWQKWSLPLLTGLILIEAAALPYPTLEYRVPEVYEEIARDEGDFTVLEIPSFNWRYAAKNETYQVVHQKRILRAYTNRIAPDIADYFTLRQTPIVVRSARILEGEEEGVLTPEEVEQDRAALNDTVYFFNLRYAIVHRDEVDSEQAKQIDSYLRNVLGATLFYEDETVRAYRFAPARAPAPPFRLNLADNSSLMYLGRGWQTEPLADESGEQGRYLKGTTTDIYLPDSSVGARTIDLRILVQDEPQELTFTLDGKPLSKDTAPDGWTDYSLQIPPSGAPTRLHLLQIMHADAPGTVAIGSIQLK